MFSLFERFDELNRLLSDEHVAPWRSEAEFEMNVLVDELRSGVVELSVDERDRQKLAFRVLARRLRTSWQPPQDVAQQL